MERHLEGRLVEARERAARVRRLELGEGVAVLPALDDVRALVVAPEGGVVPEGQRDGAGAEGRGEPHRRDAARADLLPRRGDARLRALSDDDLADREILPVEPKDVPRAIELDLDARRPLEARARGVHPERQRVLGGPRVRGEAAERRRLGRRRRADDGGRGQRRGGAGRPGSRGRSRRRGPARRRRIGAGRPSGGPRVAPVRARPGGGVPGLSLTEQIGGLRAGLPVGLPGLRGSGPLTAAIEAGRLRRSREGG